MAMSMTGRKLHGTPGRVNDHVFSQKTSEKVIYLAGKDVFVAASPVSHVQKSKGFSDQTKDHEDDQTA